jgi:hypothetical protein
MTATIVHRGRWTRDARAADRWPRLPFDVPPRCPGFTVTLDFEDGVLDLGCEDPTGWRGWSGGARRTFGIGPTAATPGYLPGELPPGTWHVVLGLHRIPPDGCDYAVSIEFGVPALPPEPPFPDNPARPPRRELPAPDGLRWVATDLHAHTVHSDGELTVAELAALAVSRGLDALAVTDHNTVSHHAELAAAGRRYGIALLPGQEVTTEFGHANAFGAIGWVDFRRPAADWVSFVDFRGGLLSVNHPLAGDCAWRQPLPVRPPLAEVWHSSWLAPRWGGPLAWWQAWGMDTTPVGGSDWHRPGTDAPPGTPTTWVAVDAAADGPAELVDAVLAGLRAGRTAISAGGPVLLPMGDDVLAVDAAGTLLIGPDGRTHPVRSDRCALPEGGQILCDHDGATLALAGRSRT